MEKCPQFCGTKQLRFGSLWATAHQDLTPFSPKRKPIDIMPIVGHIIFMNYPTAEQMLFLHARLIDENCWL